MTPQQIKSGRSLHGAPATVNFSEPQDNNRGRQAPHEHVEQSNEHACFM